MCNLCDNVWEELNYGVHTSLTVITAKRISVPVVLRLVNAKCVNARVFMDYGSLAYVSVMGRRVGSALE